MALRRTIRDLVVDLNSVSESLHPAVEKVLEDTAKQVLDVAQRGTPVKTGFMRSRWRNDRAAAAHWSVSNDTYYLPIQNQRPPNAGFADAIASEAADLLAANLGRLEFATSFRKGGMILDYPKSLMDELRVTQEAIKRAEGFIDDR